MHDLLINASASGSEVVVPAPGVYTFECVGTFGGASVALQKQGPDGSTFYGIGSGAVLTSPGGCNVEIPAGRYKAAVSGGTPSGLYARLAPVKLL